MKSLRILTVYLCLAALLLGNVAGWVHVGCSHHATGCCSVDLSSVDEATALKTAVDPNVGHTCCHHGHSCQSEPVSGETDPTAPNPTVLGNDGSTTPAEQHDSDNCSVCQSFFASRHAVTLADTVVFIQRIAITRDAVLIDDVFASSQLSRSHAVRGPPSV